MQKTAANPPARCSQEPARCRGAVGTQPTPIAPVPMGLPARRCIGLRIWGKTGKTWNCIQLGKLKLGRETGLLPPASVSLPPRQGARPSPALCCCLVASGGGKTTGKQTPWKSEEMQIKREKQTRPNNRAPQGAPQQGERPRLGAPIHLEEPKAPLPHSQPLPRSRWEQKVPTRTPAWDIFRPCLRFRGLWQPLLSRGSGHGAGVGAALRASVPGPCSAPQGPI